MKLFLAYAIIILATVGVITLAVINPAFRWVMLFVVGSFGGLWAMIWAIATVSKQFE